tara:strand:- start:1602 stop:1772 length:171 start_codon:yes stop_codon:yes gene_type:complete
MKSIAKVHPDAQVLLNETEYANNKMDMVRLAKEDELSRLLLLVSWQPIKVNLSLEH